VDSDHIEYFNYLVREFTFYNPQGPAVTACSRAYENISVPQSDTHIQILNGSLHWICYYYDIDNIIYVYDSLHSKDLNIEQRKFFKSLHPSVFSTNDDLFPTETECVTFPTVQHQGNYNDCGIYSVSFFISCMFGYAL